MLVQEVTAIDEVHAQNADTRVLQQRVGFVESGMENDRVGRLVRGRLEPHAKPTVSLYGLVVVDGRHRVGEGEILFGGVLLSGQALFAQLVLVVEHLFHPRFADIAPGFLDAVDGVTEVFVVGADGLGDGAAGPACAKEVAHHLLSSPDFGEGAVQVVVHVDPQCLLLGRKDDATAFHVISNEGVYAKVPRRGRNPEQVAINFANHGRSPHLSRHWNLTRGSGHRL